jgi:MauM/NapG family ferredoxin protein
LVSGVTDTLTKGAPITDVSEAPRKENQDWLRPPGALGEEEFLTHCTRCTACQEACPYQSIRRLGPEFGRAAGTPAIIPHESPCYLCEDMPCISACEPLALRHIPRGDVRMGTARIDLSACYVALGQRCDYCVSRCPLGRNAIAFGSNGLPIVKSPGCAGCGVCGYLCPADVITINPPN